jgi:hypothetical protein
MCDPTIYKWSNPRISNASNHPFDEGRVEPKLPHYLEEETVMDTIKGIGHI